MGLFSFIGKALKGVSKVAGFIPGIGGTISKITGGIGGLLDHKRPMSNPRLGNPMAARGKVVSSRLWTATKIRASPVMPGGAIATTRGIMTASSAAPPESFGARFSRTVARRARSADPYGDEVRAQRKYGRKRRAKTRVSKSVKRKGAGRRLKFGSPAWRKKYMKRR